MNNLAEYIDHTLLKATATPDDIRKLCSEAMEHSFKAVCVNPSYVALALECLSESEVKVATVAGFPLGALTPEQKAKEAAQSVELGADEVDMVINIGAAKAGNWDLVLEDIQAVREATQDVILKVIIETCYLTDAEKEKATELVLQAGADFVKTSTGFGTGGATLEDIQLMARVTQGKIGIKAAGGVKTFQDAQRFIEAGATRLGTSSGVALVQGQTAGEGY
ncbi:deoxyribose-phosphate aldolase [Deinococcus cellulosilyticus]|uniref:Deoxyribose-phosphate aldolase n=1 Tax=Deinococcus cellulosilyticus (strain DSM 18568 / NBRC 106333 / KACC 11606 / 5516J-15) TaxID=1223518 RepID=A0A511MX64_DEIC1|nr:deoxyribose-phosphate aldolase [Deinococcus cellulosilyticus]GEM44736.1 deoxyribose-phosphate aldolase [Deinococcus cellulosilyticus NBRC 106333 = KACC 11606]